jgi:fucose 4-O-acetylase-like acetyltransferase
MREQKPRIPDGIGASAVLWFLAGLYTIYGSFNALNSGDIARTFGVPIEFSIIIVFFVMGFAQIIDAFGLWTGKSYSYRLTLIIPLFAVGINLALASLYASAPSKLNLTSNSALVNAIGWVIWIFVYRWYFGKPYVKAYLERSKSNTTANISDSNS